MRHKIYIAAIISIILIPGLPDLIHAQKSDLGIIPGKKYLWFGSLENEMLEEKARPVVSFPPFCGKKRREIGHDLALPFGATAVFEFNRQFYNATDLMLNSDSTNFFATGNASVQQSTAGHLDAFFRPDIWLLPILNIYGIFGYSRTTIRPKFEVQQVLLKNPDIGWEDTLDLTVSIDDELVFYGPRYGGGASVSAGFNSFFFVLDYHYVVSKPNGSPDAFESQNFAARLGILLGHNRKKTKGSLWVGFNYVNDNQRFTGAVDVKDIAPELEFLVGEKATYSGKLLAKQYWNLQLGGFLIVSKHHILSLEAGYFTREQLSLSYGFRF
jgi:hypothetical protein